MYLTNTDPKPQAPAQESDVERERLLAMAERDQLDDSDGDDEVYWFIIEHKVDDEMLMLSAVAARTHDEAIENAKQNQIDNIVNMMKVPDPDMTLEALNELIMGVLASEGHDPAEVENFRRLAELVDDAAH